MYQLYNADCIQVMRNMPANSIDFVLTDPPFEMTQCSWDNALNLADLWGGVERVTKINAPVALFGIEPFASKVRMSNLKHYKYDWIWRKPRGTGHLNCKKQPMRDYECIMIFYKKQCTYNPQYSKGEPYSALKGGKTSYVSNAGETTYGKFMNGAQFRNDNSGFRYPKQVIEFGVVERNTLHPTQKPVELLEYLIKTYTNEGETVLDATLGSGSTGVAALNTGRNFIGIELDKNYFEIASKRIADAQERIDKNEVGNHT